VPAGTLDQIRQINEICFRSLIRRLIGDAFHAVLILGGEIAIETRIHYRSDEHCRALIDDASSSHVTSPSV